MVEFKWWVETTYLTFNSIGSNSNTSNITTIVEHPNVFFSHLHGHSFSIKKYGKTKKCFYKYFYIWNAELYLLLSSIIASVFHHIPHCSSYIVRLLHNWWEPIPNYWTCRLFPTVIYHKHFGDELSDVSIVVCTCMFIPGNTLQKQDYWIRGRPMFGLLMYTAK